MATVAEGKKSAKHRPRLFLIDSYGFIFRAYHARARSGAPPMRTTTGLSTEAVYIFHNMVRKLREAHQPEYFFCGHIHEAEGAVIQMGSTRAQNVGKKGYLLDL